MNREIKFIVIHSTKTHSSLSVEKIRSNWKFNNQQPQYHCVIDRNGHAGRILGMNLIAEQSFPQNESCFHIAYIGGLVPNDTRTPLQSHILFEKIEELQKIFPNTVVIGAGEFTNEENPGFDVTSWMSFYSTHREDWIALDVEDEQEEICLLED